MEIQKVSRFNKKIYLAVGAIVLVLFVIFAFWFITQNNNSAVPSVADKTEIDIKVIEERVRSIAELSTLTYEYSDVGVFSQQKSLSLFGNEIGVLGTSKSFIITYDGVMKFGTDLSKLYIGTSGKELTVIIPKIEMLSHEVKEDSIMLLDEKSGLFAAFSMNDYKDFMVEQKDKMEARAVERNLYEQAQLYAEVQIKAFILAIPGLDEEYDNIRFDFR